MVWSDITFTSSHLLTASDMNRLHGNFTAIAAGEVGAPPIAVNSLVATGVASLHTIEAVTLNVGGGALETQANKGSANGYASLDGTAKVPEAELPDGSVTTHEAAADPHVGYQKESDKGAVNGYAGLGAGGYLEQHLPLLHVRDEKASGTGGGTFTLGAWRTRDSFITKTNEISGASAEGVISIGAITGGPYTVGETVTGGTSGAAGVYVSDAAGVMTLKEIDSPFSSGETLTGSSSGATCTSSSPLAGGSITLPAGTYWAEFSCPAYRVNRHKAKLYNTSDSSDTIDGSTEVSGGASSDFNMTRSFGSGRFTIAGTKTFETQHRGQTTAATSGFGLESNFSVVEVYTDLKIWKVA